MTKKVTIYKDCDMILWNFTQFLKTRELKYFTVELVEVKGLEEAMNAVFIEYAELTNNNTLLNRFATMFNILKYQTKYDDVMMLCKGIYNYVPSLGVDGLNALVSQLEKWNYRIDRNNPLIAQVEKIYNRAQGIKTKVALLTQDLQDEDEKEVVTIESQLLNVGRILELNYKINQKETTLREWAEMQQQAIRTVNSRKK